MPTVTPIEATHLDEVGCFLNTNLNIQISAEAWIESLTHHWAESQPNFGMQLRDDSNRLVGVFCAIYSDQVINGRIERFCNPHSWCVLPEHRSAGINLVLRLLKQPGYHFTMFTPNPKVARIFQGLKFRNLDDRLVLIPNVPSLWPRRGTHVLEGDTNRIAQYLDEQSLRDFNAHRSIRWLRFAVFGQAGDLCLAVYKTGRWKRLPCARILHLSNTGAFTRHRKLLQRHLLMDRGLPISRIESRLLAIQPRLAYRAQRTQPKLVLSQSLRDAEIPDLYSELVALDV